MGQKVNPILFRSGLKKNVNPFLVSPTRSHLFSHLLIQEIEIKNFLSFLLRSRGILLRSCKFSRTEEKFSLDLDLYFASLFGKESKLSWVRSTFKNMKKKYNELNKVKDLKIFLDSSQFSDERLKKIPFRRKLRKYSKFKSKFKSRFNLESILKSKKEFRLKKKLRKKRIQNFICRVQKGFSNQSKLSIQRSFKYKSPLKLLKSFKKTLCLRKLRIKPKKSSLKYMHFKKFKLKAKGLKKSKLFNLVYKRRLFYFLLYKKKKGVEWGKNDDESLFSVNQSHLKSSSDFGRLSILKLYRLFALRKLKYNFSSLFLRNFISARKSFKRPVKIGQSLLDLNKLLCQSLQNYSGIEKVSIRLSSTQLSFLPSFKLYKKFLVRKLASLKRNRDFKNYFIETVELFYFVLGSFGQGNAALVAKYISRLLEKNRKQLLVVRFLKKCLQLFFEKMPKSFLAVEGIRILMKGRFNKRRRTKKIVISQGQISLQTLDTCLDYSQTQAITLYGSFGIKVWISKRRD